MDIYSASIENNSIIVEWEVDNGEIHNVLVVDKSTKEEVQMDYSDLDSELQRLMKSVMAFEGEQL